MKTSQTRRGFLKAGAASFAAAAVGVSTNRTAAEEARTSGKAATKKPFDLGVASYTFRKFKLEETLAMTRRVGLNFICFKSFHLPLDSKPDEIAAVVEKVKAAGLTLYAGGVITMNKEPDVNQAFDYAKAAGMKMIIGSPSPAMLPLVEKKVQQTNIQVAIHNHGPGDKTYPTPQSVYEKIANLDKRIGLCIDIGHTTRIGSDPIRSAEQYGDRLLDVHIKDVAGTTPESKETVVGRGIIDIPRLCRTLVKVGYSGILSFEYENDENDPLAGLAESVGYVRGVMAAI